MRKAGSALGAGSRVHADNGKPLELGKLVKSGGAGSVYLLPEEPERVAKIYHAEIDLALYERKIQAMLHVSPDLPDLTDGGTRITQIAWPQALLRDGRKRFRGFTMPRLHLDETIELEYILQERQARAAGLPVGLGARVTLAANVSALVAELHRQRHYVVDLKPVNIRFYRQSLHLAMLDCDGFSIHSETERFPAPQYTPDYLAPEFHRHDLKVGAEEEQDRFALAIIIFQLLNFGIHPFSGRPVDKNAPTDIPGRIAGRYYAYGLRAHKGMQPNLASGHEELPQELRHLLDRAFGGNGQSRPTASEWARVLATYALRSSGRLVVCARNKEHQYFAGKKCAACSRAALIARVASAPKAGSTVRPTPTRPAQKAKRPRTFPPQPAPASPPATKINWWTMVPLIVVSIVLGLPFLLLKLVDNWLAKRVPQWHPRIKLVAALTSIVSVILVSGYLFFSWMITVPSATPGEQASSASTTQVRASTNASAGITAQRPRSIGAEDVDALLKTASQGNGAAFDKQFAELAKRPGPTGSDDFQKAQDALAEHGKALRRKTHASGAPEDLDQYLEKAAIAAPHDSGILSEVGYFRLLHLVNLTTYSPYDQVWRAWGATRKTYHAAIAADPDDYSHWHGLGMACAAMEDQTQCAESAFAVSNYVKQKVLAAAARQQENAQRIRKGEFADSRFRYAEFFFTEKGKARLTTLKERGIVLAEKLKETPIPPAEQTSPGQPIGR